MERYTLSTTVQVTKIEAMHLLSKTMEMGYCMTRGGGIHIRVGGCCTENVHVRSCVQWPSVPDCQSRIRAARNLRKQVTELTGIIGMAPDEYAIILASVAHPQCNKRKLKHESVRLEDSSVSTSAYIGR